jgi:hypothetical protein
LARSVNKPIVLEEAGFATGSQFASMGYSNDPAGYLKQMYRYANASQYSGTMVWQCLPSGLGSSGYNFDFDAPQFKTVAAQAACMNSKTAGREDCSAINVAAAVILLLRAAFTCANRPVGANAGNVDGACNTSCIAVRDMRG